MKINIHAGHNPDGMTACGAVGLIKESTEARKVKDLVIKKLKKLGHTVFDCTCDNGKSQSDVLQKIVKKCNDHEVDLDVSIHFNAGAGDNQGNGSTTGTEVLIYNSEVRSCAENVAKAISALGFKNRGVKNRTDLYFLKHTKAPAMLIECCFVDDKDDVSLYTPEKMANAIVKGLTGCDAKNEPSEENKGEKGANFEPYKVRVTVASLNVRSGAGTNFPVTNTIQRWHVFTIVEEHDGWGKLKSGAGWICLKYTEKV